VLLDYLHDDRLTLQLKWADLLRGRVASDADERQRVTCARFRVPVPEAGVGELGLAVVRHAAPEFLARRYLPSPEGRSSGMIVQKPRSLMPVRDQSTCNSPIGPQPSPSTCLLMI
jgi:hypothetical protein